MKLLTFLILILCVFSINSYAQSWEVEGTVYAFNKYPLNKVNVTTKKTKISTTTDEQGKFKIQVNKNDQIIFEASAFKKFIYRPKNNEKSIRVNLIFEDKKNNKEVAINGGFINREHLEDGLKNFATENNVYSSFVDVFDAVVYAIPSAKIINENGVRKFQLRGVKSTTGSNAALLVVNGYLMEDISFIIPSNIISIKQLRPASAAIYGTGSANGVIEIKTK